MQAVAAATVGAQVNDANVFWQSGLFELTVLAKPYTTIAPLINFVPKASFDLSAAVATNSATVGEVGMAVLRPGGEVYYLDPPIALMPTIAFNVRLAACSVMVTT